MPQARAPVAGSLSHPGENIVIPEVSEPDLSLGGLLSVGAASTTYSPRDVESLEDASFAVAEQVMDTEELRSALVPCEPSGTTDANCAEQFVREFGLRAWRRPLTDEEVTRIARVAGTAAETLDDFYDGLEYAVAALLQSPHFVFRVELGESGDFDEFALASRLSFFLWNSMPDDELFAAAESGELATDEGLRAQAERMLASPRARLGMRNFFSEMLHLYELEELVKDPTIFEHYNTLLGPDAMEETLLLMEYVVFDGQTDYRDVMTSRETFINPRLASIYRVPAPVREGFGWVELPEEEGRAGLLGHASTLNLHAHSVSTSATRRGLFIRQVLLCQEIPPPPVDVDTSIPEPTGETPTLRDRVAEHLENPTCAGCHLLLDPMGLALENFDGVGRWRDTDNGAVIDTSGDLDGTDFTDAVELGEVIRNHRDFAPCLVRTMTATRPDASNNVKSASCSR